MINYLLYFLGILIGIFIILMLISDNGDIRALFKNTKEYFENDNKFESTDIVKVAKEVEEMKDNSKIYELTDIVKVPVVPIHLKGAFAGNINDDDREVILSNKDLIDNFNFVKLLKKKEMRVLISSYNNENISNLDWITDNKDYNNNIRLKLSSNDITKELNNLNPNVNGYNIQNVSIEGPANSILYNNEKTINKFSILFMFMHKKFTSMNNNLFIIYGIDNRNIVINFKDNEYNNNNYYNVNNYDTDNNDLDGVVYDKNNINKSINLLNNYHYYENYDILSNKAKEQKSYKLSYFEKLYTIEIIIDDSVYNINDINMETLKRDITFLGLTMNNDDVILHLNNTKYEFKRNNANEIKIAKNPFVINKNKSCDIVLYSFAYFTEAISDKDLKTFKLYNKYKLYGVNNKIDDVKPNENRNSKDTNNIENI